jgi:hypothetical protein
LLPEWAQLATKKSPSQGKGILPHNAGPTKEGQPRYVPSVRLYGVKTIMIDLAERSVPYFWDTP